MQHIILEFRSILKTFVSSVAEEKGLRIYKYTPVPPLHMLWHVAITYLATLLNPSRKPTMCRRMDVSHNGCRRS